MGADTSLDEAMNKLRNTLDHITTLEAENARLRAERIDAVQAARYHEAKSAKLRAVVDAARALRDATKRHIEENISPIQAAAEGGWLCDQMFDALSALEGDQS
ncbi:hypothetical protein [Marinicauda sp. Alg238-R41]|uniref:hypothetical protein n=1 Tax=Marinicauda sp. Alg238-R41 TaxID=2993447 RepID=UPI0022E64DDD|nr:hypothetical protein [Marinicauda sp. Alg238-R41]